MASVELYEYNNLFPRTERQQNKVVVTKYYQNDLKWEPLNIP